MAKRSYVYQLTEEGMKERFEELRRLKAVRRLEALALELEELGHSEALFLWDLAFRLTELTLETPARPGTIQPGAIR